MVGGGFDVLVEETKKEEGRKTPKKTRVQSFRKLSYETRFPTARTGRPFLHLGAIQTPLFPFQSSRAASETQRNLYSNGREKTKRSNPAAFVKSSRKRLGVCAVGLKLPKFGRETWTAKGQRASPVCLDYRVLSVVRSGSRGLSVTFAIQAPNMSQKS